MNNKLLEKYLEKIKGKKILIQGLGLNGGGVGTSLFFLSNGINIKITDMKTKDELKSSIDQLKEYEDKIEYVLGEHRVSDFEEADIIVKGPGVSPDNPYIMAAKNKNREITSDIAIFLELCPCPIYAVTGSKGKSTTVSVIYSIFKTYSENSFLGGNITISPLTFYDKLNKDSLVILELSSWQLRDIEYMSPRFHGAIFTNLMKDHQNYYKSMDDYLKDKLVIAKGQTKDDFIIIPDDKIYVQKKYFQNQKVYVNGIDIYYKDNKAIFNKDGKEIILFDKSIIKLQGEHNHYNIINGATLCYLAGINLESIEKGISNFTGVPFRMELIKEWNGIKFINDTTATIPEAAKLAIESFKNQNLIWIGGGNDKNLDFSCLKEVINIPKKIYLLKGNGTDKMIETLGLKNLKIYESLEDVFDDIKNIVKPGDTVLLSPGATSFGLFQNEFHRGRVFNELVNKIFH